MRDKDRDSNDIEKLSLASGYTIMTYLRDVLLGTKVTICNGGDNDDDDDDDDDDDGGDDRRYSYEDVASRA